VFIRHIGSDVDPLSELLNHLLQGSLGRGRWRTDDELRALFGKELTILPPGLVPTAEWRPTTEPEDLTDWQRLIAAGLAVKP
jgi:hypothetical protein